MKTPEFNSPNSVAKRQTVPMDVNDPRLSKLKQGITRARQGAEIQVVDIGGTGNLTTSSLNSVIQVGAGNQLKAADANSFNSTYIQIVNAIVNPGPNDPTGRPNVVNLGEVSITSCVWSGNDIVVTFEFDSTLNQNQYANEFIVHAIATNGAEGRSKSGYFKVNKATSTQTITFTKDINIETMHGFTVSFSSFCIYAVDTIGVNTGNEVCVVSFPSYNDGLSAPVITVTAVNNGYSVSYVTPTSTYTSIEIAEYESNSSTEPTGVTYNTIYSNTFNPAVITSPNLNQRWVKARFFNLAGNSTAYSAAVKVTPISTISADLVPPNEVSSVSASWSGDDIHISYTLPSTDPAVRIQIQLTAPNNLVGYFYRFPDSPGTSQSTIIYKKDLFDQFGEHYSSFSGILKSIDSADNRSSGVSFNVATRANPLFGITPTFTVTALSNAYSISTVFPTGAVFFEVYAKHTAWSGDPTDETYLVYAGSSPAVIIDTDYTTVYFKIRYYDDFNNTSNFSTQGTITPLNPGTITSFENPISFGSNAVIYAGNSYNSGTRTLFKPGGIFAYDATNSSPSTQIVSNASAGTPTFITTQAQIADWNVTAAKIENTLSGTPTKYVGLSATGTYSFWAGSSTSGGDSSAKFTVTPTGAVTAREIYIVGTGDANSKLIDAGGAFYVKHDGSIYASAAEITGKITASSGAISGNLTIGSSGSLTSGTVGAGSGNAGYILNTSGLRFDYGSTQGITQIVGSTGQLITTKALIGGWTIDSSTISKTSSYGTLSLDSSSAIIKAYSATYSAGIKTPTSNSASDVAFWAGYGQTPSTSSTFNVTADGTLRATNAILSGTVSSKGTYAITMDGARDAISFSSGTTIFARDSASTPGAVASGTATFFTNSNPFNSSDPSSAGYTTINTDSSTGLNSKPYIAIGANKNSYGTSMEGVGLYTSGSYINVTTNNGIGIMTGDTAVRAGIILNGGKVSIGAVDSGLTSITDGANGTITITSSTVQLTARQQRVDLAGYGVGANGSTAYSGKSQITLSRDYGVMISGIPVQKDIDMSVYTGGYYLNTYPLGPYPRQRMVVEDPVTGMLTLGMGVYYSNGVNPVNAGYVGDLWVVY